MNKIKLTGVALAIGAASMFALAPAFADDASSSSGMVKCQGGNACKGQSSCKTADNACKGQNSCKGKGISEMSKDDCQKAGGTVVQ
ncbi:hypothetical protein [Legionella cincinnatiensis]|uniref:Silver efflux pump n=1 Tax=Legionella cincinnatiensis TaxID=28085 RepID=A0A378IN88_9GAMM|nr:hypothetical protein [Legionella cincinnatiensis]KTC81837.1 silver efflux pump [Legionella cincinnatiensis]STX36125.1 silver efflux pump [Legionella cincinnatiensis]